MIKLKIVNIDSYEYTLEDEDKTTYIIEMEFWDIKDTPKIGDYICINEELLNPQYDGYSTSYTFGSVNSIYGKEDISEDDIDVIKIFINNKEILLKRLYG